MTRTALTLALSHRRGNWNPKDLLIREKGIAFGIQERDEGKLVAHRIKTPVGWMRHRAV